jgi:hypothetical protein
MTQSISTSPPITISDGEIYALLDVKCTTGQLEAAASYARRKLEYYRNLFPDIKHYDNDYLVILTGDCLRELVVAQYTERRFYHGRKERANPLPQPH